VGDFLVAITSIETLPGHTNASTGVISAPAPWVVLSQNVSTSGTDLQVQISYKFAAAGDIGGTSNYTWNFTGSGGDNTFLASSTSENYSNIGATPIESTTANCTATASSATISAPGLTTGKGNDLNVPVWVIAAHDGITPSNALYIFHLFGGLAPAGSGPLPAISSLAIPLSGTATGTQTATGAPTAGDNLGCQFNLSATP